MEEFLSREEMWRLISIARRQRGIVTNPEWIMAYDNFIFACSTLDAFMARSSGPVSIYPEENTECVCNEPLCAGDDGSGKV